MSRDRHHGCLVPMFRVPGSLPPNSNFRAKVCHSTYKSWNLASSTVRRHWQTRWTSKSSCLCLLSCYDKLQFCCGYEERTLPLRCTFLVRVQCPCSWAVCRIRARLPCKIVLDKSCQAAEKSYSIKSIVGEFDRQNISFWCAPCFVIWIATVACVHISWWEQLEEWEGCLEAHL